MRWKDQGTASFKIMAWTPPATAITAALRRGFGA